MLTMHTTPDDAVERQVTESNDGKVSYKLEKLC